MVSVIIPSYNSQNTIEDCLNALSRQTYGGPMEIILADSSEDATQLIVREKFPEVQLIPLPTKTDPGTARNQAIEISKGDIICCIDSDCVADKQWVEKMVKTHADNVYSAVGGIILNGNDPASNTAWAGYLAEFRDNFPNSKSERVPHIPTCNISYKRSVFRKEGGFNPDYYPQEDLEFNYRLTNRGHKIYLDASVKVAHTHRTNFLSFLKHQHRFGKITAYILKIVPQEGSKLVQNRLYLLATIWFIPVVKWLRTLKVTWQKQAFIIYRHPLAFVFLAIGLIPWAVGFLQSGLFQKRRDEI